MDNKNEERLKVNILSAIEQYKKENKEELPMFLSINYTESPTNEYDILLEKEKQQYFKLKQEEMINQYKILRKNNRISYFIEYSIACVGAFCIGKFIGDLIGKHLINKENK